MTNKDRPSKLKRSAQRAVSIAVLNGKLVRPKLCSECGKRREIQAHHNDYCKPYDIQWLCRLCHKAIHITLGWGFGVER